MSEKVYYRILQNQGAIMLALSTLLETRADLFAKMAKSDLEGCIKETGKARKQLKVKPIKGATRK